MTAAVYMADEIEPVSKVQGCGGELPTPLRYRPFKDVTEGDARKPC